MVSQDTLVEEGVAMRHAARFLFMAMVVACALTLVGAAVTATTASMVREKVFSDSQGEVVRGPDIRKVTISQDGEVLTVEAEVKRMPEILSPGTAIFYLDTDGEPKTGAESGANYVLYLDIETMQSQVFRWNGVDYANAKKVRDPARSLFSGHSVGFTFSLANFGWPKLIDFGVLVARGAPEDGLVDGAPDRLSAGKLWSFGIRPSVTDFDLSFTPSRPRAGAVFAARVPKLTLSDGSKVVPKTFSCEGVLGGMRLTGLGRAGACRWRIPKSATGKRFVVTATVAYGDERAEFMPWKFRVA
jgi:hypothetical protein